MKTDWFQRYFEFRLIIEGGLAGLTLLILVVAGACYGWDCLARRLRRKRGHRRV